MAFNGVRHDLNEFENFDNFDTSQINIIKQRNHIELIVNAGFDQFEENINNQRD